MTRLKQMRLASGISQNKLAKALGVSTPSVNTMEKKGIYNTRIAQRYASVLKCPVFFLLEGLDCEYNAMKRSEK